MFRYYRPYLNQFIQADTIIPDYRNPQTINKYSYALNNPVRYVDPSGHYFTEDDIFLYDAPYRGYSYDSNAGKIIHQVQSDSEEFDITYSDSTPFHAKYSAVEAAKAIGNAVLRTGASKSDNVYDAFKELVEDGVHFVFKDRNIGAGQWIEENKINIYGVYESRDNSIFGWMKTQQKTEHLFVHEIGHLIDVHYINLAEKYDEPAFTFSQDLTTIGKISGNKSEYAGYAYQDPVYGQFLWKQHIVDSRGEEGYFQEQFANSFVGWVYNASYIGNNRNHVNAGKVRLDSINRIIVGVLDKP